MRIPTSRAKSRCLWFKEYRKIPWDCLRRHKNKLRTRRPSSSHRDLCKAYSRNIKKVDQRASLSHVWKNYYELDMDPTVMYCDGCRSTQKDAKRIDSGCPVRSCDMERELNSCADCREYPCDVFAEREGLCFEQAKLKRGDGFSGEEFNAFLRAFDNRTRLDRLRRALGGGRATRGKRPGGLY